MIDEPTRPDPDALLDKIKSEEQQAKRGRLKIFFGSSAGVGKTYAMLSAAHEIQNSGKDVAIGVVETHKRPETEKLMEGLPVIPPARRPYRGLWLDELDLDAARARKPQIVLIDELAHTNAPGSRHPKRWLDVMELLDAGIDVYTTLNVQHIESLADLVAGSTGVWVRETVPDSIFDTADEIMLVDIDADDLLKRLKEGKVYLAPQVKARAAESFFKKTNLIALRELALRRTAERVDAQMTAYNDQTGETDKPAIAEKILVCTGPWSSSAKLIRTAKRLSSTMKAPWFSLCVEPSTRPFDESDRRVIESLNRMVERIGGRAVQLQGDSIPDEVVAFARDHHFTKILVGKSARRGWRNLFRKSIADDIIHKSGAIDVYVVTEETVKPDVVQIVRSAARRATSPWPYFLAFLSVALCALAGLALRDLFAPTDQALLLVTSILLVAVRLGLGPALFAAGLAAASFNFFFIEPYYTFGITHRSYMMTFIVMLLTGYVVATQAARLRAQTLSARRKEKQTQSLFRLTRALTSTRGRPKVSEVIGSYTNEMFDVQSTVWLPGAEGQPTSYFGHLPDDGYMKELGVLQWCFDNGQIAGRHTDTLPSAKGLYFPLLGNDGTSGVLGILPNDDERRLTLDEISVIEILASLLTTALERVRAGEIAEQAKIKAESETLRAELEKARDAILEAQKGNFAPCLEIYKPVIED
jgi:two-component system sensor histidine kinase KdpD